MFFNKYVMKKHKYKLSEKQYRVFKQMLNEDQESDSQKKAISMAMLKLDISKDDATKLIKKDLRMKVIYLNANKKAGKFTLGAFRIYLDDSTTIAMNTLNRCLEILCNDDELYNRYDKNLNGLDLQDLYTELKSNHINKSSKSNIKKGLYDIVKIKNFKQASEYNSYTSWCVTHSEYMFNKYTCNGLYQFYFLLSKDFDKIEKQNENNTPLDKYGLSMIAVCVGFNGKMVTCTCRWNHSNGGNDHVLSEDDIVSLVGKNNASKIFQEPESLKKYIQVINKINGREIVKSIRDTLKDIEDIRIIDKPNDHYLIYNKLLQLSMLVKDNNGKIKVVLDSIYGTSTLCDKYLAIYKTEENETEEIVDIYDTEMCTTILNDMESKLNFDKGSILKKDGKIYILSYEFGLGCNSNLIKNSKIIDGMFNIGMRIFLIRIDGLYYLFNSKTFKFLLNEKPLPEQDDVTKYVIKFNGRNLIYYKREGNYRSVDIPFKVRNVDNPNKVYNLNKNEYLHVITNIQIEKHIYALLYNSEECTLKVKNLYDDINNTLFEMPFMCDENENAFDITRELNDFARDNITFDIDLFKDYDNKKRTLIRFKGDLYDADFNLILKNIRAIFQDFVLMSKKYQLKVIEYINNDHKEFNYDKYVYSLTKDDKLYYLDEEGKAVEIG